MSDYSEERLEEVLSDWGNAGPLPDNWADPRPHQSEQDVPLVERLRCEPGDVIVYCCPRRLSPVEARDIAMRFDGVTGLVDIPVVVMDGGARLQVVNKADLESA
jgi:hypothetical protein